MSARTITTEMPIIITTDDLSDIGYAADTAYLKWVQAVVIKHWECFAPAEALASTLWIAVRHKVRYRTAGVAADRIVAKTSIKRLKGVRAIFTTIFYRDSEVLAEVESTWVCIDRTTKQPKALDSEVLSNFHIG